MSITDPQTKQYLREIAALKGDPRLTALEEYASRRFIPIIHKEAADCLLYFCVRRKPDAFWNWVQPWGTPPLSWPEHPLK